MGVYLREKKLKNGKVSLYLDVYHNGHRYPPDFLEIHINKKNPTDEDKEKLKLANEKRKAIDLQLTADNLQLINKKLAKADFIEWCRGYFNSKTKNRSYKKVLDYLSEFVNHAPLPFYKIDLNLCRDFQKFLFTKGSNNGVLHLMVILFGGLKEAEKRNYIHKNPMLLMDKSDRLKKKEIPPTSFSIEQLQKLADTPIKINPQYRQAYFFSCFSGLRWSDANCLKWDEIITKTINGVEKWFMFFEQEKTENPEYLPLSEQAIFILKMRMEERENEPESPYVFPAVKETNEKTTPVYQRVKYALKKWAKAAGIDPKIMAFHTGRHSFAVNMLEHSDIDLFTLSKLMGHRSLASTQVYANIRDSKKAAIISAMPTIKLRINPHNPEPTPSVGEMVQPLSTEHKEAKVIQLVPTAKQA